MGKCRCVGQQDTASLSGIAWAWNSAAIWESRSADILKLGSTVAVGAVGSSVAIIGAGDGRYSTR